MIEFASCDAARAELARLHGLHTERDAELATLRTTLAALEVKRGEAALLAADTGDTKPVGVIVAEIAKVRIASETVVAVLGALAVRQAEAAKGQRGAVAAELLRQADAADAEFASRCAKLKELLQLLTGFEGDEGSAMLIPGRGRTVALEARAAGLRTAASFIGRGLPCPVDPATAASFDSGLW